MEAAPAGGGGAPVSPAPAPRQLPPCHKGAFPIVEAVPLERLKPLSYNASPQAVNVPALLAHHDLCMSIFELSGPTGPYPHHNMADYTGFPLPPPVLRWSPGPPVQW